MEGAIFIKLRISILFGDVGPPLKINYSVRKGKSGFEF